VQLFVLRRVVIVDAAGEHGDCAALESGKVSRRIDAAGKAGGDDEAFMSEIGRGARVNFCPTAEPLRAPTIATMGISARSSLPLA
jgi:hypothetical protein